MKHVARKRFGQNFLHDKYVLASITEAIAPAPDDTLVEIGPGLGAMTEQLLRTLKMMHVVELDRDLVARLEKTYNPAKLTIHAGDALKFDFGAIPVSAGQKLRIVGNLPYNISSPLLFHLATFAPQVQDQHFMLQKEVVERMVAPPGSKTYGRLSVMLQWRYDMTLLFVVPPEAFDPPPKVESAIVRMIPVAQPLACDGPTLEAVVLKAFSQRRKVIRNCLAGMFTEAQIVAAGIDPTDRPEMVGLAQYVALANLL
ncbi:16S rRNA (adenine(1518)-N(6)/adenine(1519)-N(6))-dimethyltransferase RsmA [Duganella aceris]|uniref:Ribosomal RNA small subunit methyltransferase A n=1 Tax=Duganella aceris TaxID=2703883 RepID=A0ABX0FR76_9BURK|nr:16S rRNA (adenine(1518)-N(6)/adenine(1519)-N(6))-dimethyltransferase RsmA [Duganella aceris]NGZ86962.1 16S rRNA (adenine(1518)-N(6)/adenine(1519)-N(6))-dimethyltransferase RsmA [Duganella aceris]